MPACRGDSVFEGIHLLSVHAVGNRSALPALPVPSRYILQRLSTMSVASHLGIRLADYDARIRTFIPDYEEMLGVAAAAIPARTRTIVDLGIGTGALSARCLAPAPAARVTRTEV